MNVRAWVGAAAILVAALWVSPKVGVVTSGSMAPYLQTGDGFVTLRLAPREGDVVVYRPRVLPADSVVHRVVGRTQGGLITKGDAASQTDQAGGEPPVSQDRVQGVVVLKVPALGPVVARVLELRDQLGFAEPLRWFLLPAILLWLWVGGPPTRREMRRWWRVRVAAVVRTVGILAGLAAVAGALAGSRTPYPVEYLVTESPGITVPWHVGMGQAGSLPVTVRNPGLVPVVFVTRGVDGSQPEPLWGVIPPQGRSTVMVQVAAETAPGWRRAYLDVYVYPLLSPAAWLATLARLHPLLALAWVGVVPTCLGMGLARWAETLPPLGYFLGWPRPRR